MVSLKSLVFAALASSAIAGPLARPGGRPPPKSDCGKYNIILEGLPPNHPTVIAQGYNPVLVESALRADFAKILKAGYNARYTLVGPEIDHQVLEDELEGIKWAAAGVGFGVRGSNSEELTAELEKILAIFRKDAPESTFIFNRSPNTTLEAIERHFPLKSDCTNSPGKDLGFNIFCGVC